MDFEKMKREEQEAVDLMYGTTTADESPTDVVLVKDEDFTDDLDGASTEATTNEEEVFTPNPVKESTPRTSWKKRYANFKASTDNTIFELRKDVAMWKSKYAESQEATIAMTSTIRDLKAEAAAKVDPFEGVVSKEEQELIGEDAVDIMKKVAAHQKGDNAEVELLKKKLDLMERERLAALKRDSVSLEEESMERLKASLTTIVPDWSTIDLEEGFADYVKGFDEVSGQPRMKFFQTAINDRNVSAVAGFYSAYKSLKPKSRKEVLAGHVTPTGTGGGEPQTGKDAPNKIYAIGEYMEFMDSVAKGDYRGSAAKRKEAQLLERQWDIRLSQNRVR